MDNQEQQPVREEPSEQRVSSRATARQIIWYIVDIIAALLAIRVILQLLGANQGNAFVDFIYGISGFFAAPFFTMFGYVPQYGSSYLEVGTVVAIVIYLLIGWAITRLLMIGTREAEASN